MSNSEYLSRIAVQLEGQKVLEAKVLLQKLYEYNDVKNVVEAQWLPLQTDLNHPSYSRAIALIKSPELVGYGSVLLNQPSYGNLMMVQEWIATDLFVKINVVIDGLKADEIRMVVEREISPEEVSIAVQNYVNWVHPEDAKRIGYALLSVNKV